MKYAYDFIYLYARMDRNSLDYIYSATLLRYVSSNHIFYINLIYN